MTPEQFEQIDHDAWYQHELRSKAQKELFAFLAKSGASPTMAMEIDKECPSLWLLLQSEN